MVRHDHGLPNALVKHQARRVRDRRSLARRDRVRDHPLVLRLRFETEHALMPQLEPGDHHVLVDEKNPVDGVVRHELRQDIEAQVRARATHFLRSDRARVSAVRALVERFVDDDHLGATCTGRVTPARCTVRQSHA